MRPSESTVNKIDMFEIWIPYWKMECYQSGMYKNKREDLAVVSDCCRLLSDKELFCEFMGKAVTAFPMSATHHLTHGTGYRPWLGQSACHVFCGAVVSEVSSAWNCLLSGMERDAANEAASEFRDAFLKTGWLYGQGLFRS